MHSSSFIVFLASVLASGSSATAVPYRNGVHGAKPNIVSRDLKYASYDYSYSGICCTPGTEAGPQCTGGESKVYLKATGPEGNSYEKDLDGPGDWTQTGDFDGERHCDKEGVICWSGTKTGDKSANVCVYYANTQKCKDVGVENIPGAPFCRESWHAYVEM